MHNDEKIISKKDIIFIIILLAVAVLFLVFMKMNKKTGYNVELSVKGEVVKTFSLDKDTEFRIEGEGGYNVLVIEAGTAYVKEADCPDKICVNHKKITNIGETIICLPHKLVIEITR